MRTFAILTVIILIVIILTVIVLALTILTFISLTIVHSNTPSTMRFSFNDALARALRSIQRKDCQSNPAASSAAVSTNTLKESGYKYNYFEPKVSTDFLMQSILIRPYFTSLDLKIH